MEAFYRITMRKNATQAVQPGRAADAAGAAHGLGAIHPAKRYGLLATRQRATFSLSRRTKTLGALAVGRTRIAWHLPPAVVLHAPDARQRRS